MIRFLTLSVVLFSLFACGEQPDTRYSQLAAATLDTVPPAKKIDASKARAENLTAAGFEDIQKTRSGNSD